MHIGARVAIGVGSVGGVIGGGYGLNKLLSNETIKSKLEANKYTLLNKDNKEHEKHWTTILTSYKTIIEADSNSKFKFDNFVTSKPQPNERDRAKLQKLCKDTLEKRTFEDTKDEDNYKKAIKFCTAPQTVSKRLDTIGFESLDTTTDNSKTNAHDREWEQKIKDYIDKDNKKKITSWTSGEKEEKSTLMKKCKELQDTETHQKGYETIFEEAKQWCAIPKTK